MISGRTEGGGDQRTKLFLCTVFTRDFLPHPSRSRVCQNVSLHISVLRHSRETAKEADRTLQCGPTFWHELHGLCSNEANYSGSCYQCSQTVGRPQCGLQRQALTCCCPNLVMFPPCNEGAWCVVELAGYFITLIS